jgi:hypothetical protein
MTIRRCVCCGEEQPPCICRFKCPGGCQKCETHCECKESAAPTKVNRSSPHEYVVGAAVRTNAMKPWYRGTKGRVREHGNIESGILSSGD